jgi:uncharacterized protein (TIGR02466 family)
MSELLDRAKALLEAGQAREALALTAQVVARPDASHRALALHSTGLKALKRHAEALEIDDRASREYPTSGVAWHNLAATLGDLGRGPQAVAAMQRGFDLGLDGALSWGVMARARAAAGDLDGAEQAYVETLRRAPGRAETAVEYADVVWMRRGDVEEAQAVLDRCAHAGGPPGPLLRAKARLYEAAGQAERGAALLLAAAARVPDDVGLTLAAAQAALETGRLDEAERLATAAEARVSGLPAVLNQLAIVHLAQGKGDLALAEVRRGLEIDPLSQSLLGWAATAARMTGDPLYRELCDYDAMVGVYDLETPEGWPDLAAYLGDLAAALDRVHLFETHPSAQSLRHGSQTTHHLVGSDEPAIQAFFHGVDSLIRRHVEGLGEGRDPLRSRRTDGHRIEGAWSVRLKPGGFHKDHFHGEGWLSSAFYVETPDAALDSPERQGWIRFGQPPFRTEPPLPAEHHVRPKPGRLVLFPSYMWHGTVPFTTDERRLTIAFDVVPA